MNMNTKEMFAEDAMSLDHDDPAADVALERATGSIADIEIDESESIEVRENTSEAGADGEVHKVDADFAIAETLSVTAKMGERRSLEEQMAAFLAKGGKIVEVPAD